MFKIRTIGGFGEVAQGETGKNNAMLFETEDVSLLVDVGTDPAPAKDYREDNDPLIDTILGQIRKAHENKKQFGILLTHAHLDHWGRLLPVLKRVSQADLPLPTLYGSPFTIRVIKDAIAEQLRHDERRSDGSCRKVGEEAQELIRFPAVELSPFCNIYFDKLVVMAVPVEHSVPGAFSYLLRYKSTKEVDGRKKQDWYRVLVSGDFKTMNWLKNLQHYPDLACLDLLIIEGTSVSRQVETTEAQVKESLAKLVGSFDRKDRLVFSLISSQADRTRNILEVAEANQRISGVFANSIVRHLSVWAEVDPGVHIANFVTDTRQVGRYLNTLITTGVWGQGMLSEAELMLLDQKKQEEKKRCASGLVKLAGGDPVGQYWAGDGNSKGGFYLQKGDKVILCAGVYHFVEKEVAELAKKLTEAGAEVWVDESAPKDWPYKRALLSSSGHAGYQTIRNVIETLMPAEIWPYHCEFASAKVIEEMAGAIGKKFNRLSNNHEVVLVM